MLNFKCVLIIPIRKICTSEVRHAKIVPKHLKGKSMGSQQWLTRQLNDPYVEKAKMLNYRCRSAFKLIEIDDRVNILTPGQTIIDCGASPGSWTQVAVNRTNSDGHDTKKNIGTVVAIDKLPIYMIKGAHTLGSSDFTSTETQEKIKKILGEKKVDVVLSDMAPNASGIKSLDQENIVMLCYSAFRFAVQISNVNASILVKVWDGGDVPKLENDFKRFYNYVKVIKPVASRNDSAEKFILAKGFKGLKT